jgi:LuxR family maltose regulon positive regulatory protein
VQLINTKVTIPPLRAGLVERPRLFRQLDQGSNAGFALVSAPAGYGKSTLVNAWLARAKYLAAWLTLDERDNDLFRFLDYLSLALSKIDPSFRTVFTNIEHSDQQADIELFLVPLINQLDQLNRLFYLVLDDYQEIHSQFIHQFISFLLEHRPAALYLVIITRSDPPLPLAKLRARSAMLELRQVALKFTSEEAAEFLGRTMGLNVSMADTAQLNARTEGWITGLQLAALSLQHTDNISGLIASLDGSHHYIYEYLMEEILKSQAPEIRRFLLVTSILDHLSAALCDALLQVDQDSSAVRSAAAILRQLDQMNLFLIPLDEEHHWYRYHQLFADLLRLLLNQNNPGLVFDLHRRACHWYESQGMVSDALHHALMSQDMLLVTQIISSNVLALVENHEIIPILQRLESFPHEDEASPSWLNVAQAWALAYTGQMDQAEEALAQAQQNRYSLPENEQNRLMGHIGVVKGYIAWVAGNQQEAVQFSLDAALLLLPEEYAVRSLNVTTLANALNQYEADPRTVDMLQQAIDWARHARQSHVLIAAATALGFVYTRLGRLSQAETLLLKTIETLESFKGWQGPVMPAVASVYAELSTIYTERGEIEKSKDYARKGLSLSELWGQTDTIMLCLLSLSNSYSLAEDTESSLEFLDRARKIARKVSPWFTSLVNQLEARTYLEAGDLEKVAILLHDDDSERSATLRARLLVRQNRYEEALDLIERSLSKTTNIHSQESIQFEATRSLVYFLKNEPSRALAYLQDALTLAEPENFVAPFLREGAKMENLLRLALGKSIQPAFVKHVLMIFGSRQTAKPLPPAGMNGLVEPLSARELEVLKLLAQGLSDKKIAETLVIARETVHKHLKNIYGKLGVHSRLEAIAKVREIGLLQQ